MHIAHPKFGLEVDPKFGLKVDPVEYIRKILDSAPAMCSSDAKIVLTEAYETAYGIFNHAGPGETPLALVSMQPAEYSFTQLDERLEHYAKLNVQKYFGGSFTEFIEQPTYVCNKMLDIATRLQRKAGVDIEALLRDIDGIGSK